LSVSSKIKKYASGILLLLLAGFIIASVSYITSIIPETAIPTNTQQSNPYLVYSNTSYVNNASVVSFTFNPPLRLHNAVYTIFRILHV